MRILGLVISFLTAIVGVGNWQIPLEGATHLVRPYLQPSSDYSAGHRGVDFEVNLGQRLLAPADGEVSFVGHLVNRNLIAIRHQGGLISELEPACSKLKVGDQVHKGADIGWICAADSTYQGHCAPKLCVHFSVRLNGLYFSPIRLIGGLSPTRLLPYARG